MATYEIRVFGDPVLKTKAVEVTDVDAKLVTLADQMLELMYTVPSQRDIKQCLINEDVVASRVQPITL